MELMEAIRNRRTARMFKPDPVVEEILNDILNAGTWAPSHSNNQPWEFIVIGPQTRQKLLEVYRPMMEVGPLKLPMLPEERKQGIRNFMQDFGGAPVLLAVVCPPPSNPLDAYDFPLSAAAALQNILLAAWEKQVAGVWLSLGMNPQAKTVLGVQPEGSIVGVVAMGYSDSIPPAQDRIPASDKTRRLP